MDKCDKHDDTMDRIFNKLNQAEIERTQIIAKMDNVIAFKDEIHSLVFGNGHEGLISKIRRVSAQIATHWCLIMLILTAIVGISIKLYWTHNG